MKLAVVEKLGRKWITSDLGKFGIHTTRKRLIQVQRGLKMAGKPFRAFEVLNLGRYERRAARRRQFLGERTRLGCCFRRPRRKLGRNYDRLTSA